MTGRCVFCGQVEDLHRQHIWPDWLTGAVPWGHDMHTHSKISGERQVIHQAPPFTRTVRAVCQRRCNGGWMSQLENAAKQPLLAMILGKTQPLDRDTQDVVAFWALQTAFMFAATDRVKYIPESHYHELYAGRALSKGAAPWRPIRKANVLMYAYSGTQTHGGYHPQQLEPRLAAGEDVRLPRGSKAYGVTMSLGHLVMQIFAHNVEKLDFILDPTGFEDAAFRIFPNVSEAVSWPPKLWLNDDGLRNVIPMFTRLESTKLPPPPEFGG